MFLTMLCVVGWNQIKAENLLVNYIFFIFSLFRNNLGHSSAAVLGQVLPSLSELTELE